MESLQTEHVHNDPGPRIGRVKQWAFRMGLGENRLMAELRGLFRIFFIMAHEFSHTGITLRASALTYAIILSMVPILAMSTAVLKGLGKDNQLKIAAYSFIDQFEPARKTDRAETWRIPPADAAADEERLSMTSHLRNAADTIFAYVERTNFTTIGTIGIIGLLLSVVLMLSTIESAMNEIWHTRRGRTLSRKIMDYLALLILLPVSINIALAADAALESPRIMSSIHAVIPSPWAVTMLLKLLPFLIVILTLTVMYRFFPNVRVEPYAAFAGALFAGFFWFAVQRLYIVMQVGVANYNAIYGSFATVPLFLIWIYVGWVFILLGATLAYAVQNRNRCHPPGSKSSPQRTLQLAFDILNTVYANFARNKSTGLDDLAGAIRGDTPGDIRETANLLVEGGLLHRTENKPLFYVPAMTSENIEAREVVRLILGHETIPTPGGDFSRQVIKAAEAAIPREAFPPVAPPDPLAPGANEFEI